MRKTGAQIMMENIRKTQNEFLIMNGEQRLAYLDRYEFLQPYQKTALLQCKKYMSAAEKRKFKQVTERAAGFNQSNDSEPQPN
jgi:hypothetical protein